MTKVFKLEVVDDGYILIKDEFMPTEQKKIYFSVDSLVEDLEAMLKKLDKMTEKE